MHRHRRRCLDRDEGGLKCQDFLRMHAYPFMDEVGVEIVGQRVIGDRGVRLSAFGDDLGLEGLGIGTAFLWHRRPLKKAKNGVHFKVELPPKVEHNQWGGAWEVHGVIEAGSSTGLLLRQRWFEGSSTSSRCGFFFAAPVGRRLPSAWCCRFKRKKVQHYSAEFSLSVLKRMREEPCAREKIPSLQGGSRSGCA